MKHRNLVNDLERMLKRWNTEGKAFVEKVVRLGYEPEPQLSAAWANMLTALESVETSLEWGSGFQSHPTMTEKELSDMAFTKPTNWD